jgi:Raf kinase inhibitor-like YbhB/YbcL family protein
VAGSNRIAGTIYRSISGSGKIKTNLKLITAVTVMAMGAGCAAAEPASSVASPSTDAEVESLDDTQDHSAPGFSLASDALEHGGAIPPQFTCDGEDLSPGLTWEQAPAGTRSLALLLEDPDAPGGTWVHWVLYNIPAEAQSINAQIREPSDLPGGTQVGENSWGETAYGGPCPPRGEHRYIFTLFALDTELELDGGVTGKILRSAISEHILSKTELMGTYSR